MPGVNEDIWRKAHEIAGREMKSIEAGICKLPGLSSVLATFAIECVNSAREACAKIAEQKRDEWKQRAEAPKPVRDMDPLVAVHACIAADQIALAIRKRIEGRMPMEHKLVSHACGQRAFIAETVAAFEREVGELIVAGWEVEFESRLQISGISEAPEAFHCIAGMRRPQPRTVL